MRIQLIKIGIAILLISFVGATAQSLDETKLIPDDLGADDFFGGSIAIEGSTLVVSAPGHNLGGTDKGAVYVYRYIASEWTQVQKIQPAEGSNHAWFGNSLALKESLLVVGAPYDDTFVPDGGRVWVYKDEGGTWIEVMDIVHSNIEPQDCFGTSADLHEGTLIVGADGKDDDRGAAYIFRYWETRDGFDWVEEWHVGASDAEELDRLGRSVAIDGDVIIVGAFGDSHEGSNEGSAYVFERNPADSSWQEVQKLVANDAEDNDAFGLSVILDGTLSVIGAPGNILSQDGGAVYIFEDIGDNTWIQAQKLSIDTAPDEDLFGYGMSKLGDTLFIGAPYANGLQEKSGAVYLFTKDEDLWALQSTFFASDPDQWAWYGSSVASRAHLVAIGASGDTYKGAAYVYDSHPLFIDETSGAVAESFSLGQNYPNPFNGSTIIPYRVPEASTGIVTFAVYNLLGQKIKELKYKPRSGNHIVRIESGDLASGIYIYTLRSSGFVASRSMLILR